MADYDREEEDFDADAAYYGEEPWPEESTESTSPEHMAEEYDTASASYTDARRRFTTSAARPSSSSPSSWQKKAKGGKSKGKPSMTVRYPPQGAGKSDPKGRAKANVTCLRCGQQGH